MFEKEQCNRTCDVCEANPSYDVMDVTIDAKHIIALGKRERGRFLTFVNVWGGMIFSESTWSSRSHTESMYGYL